MLGLWAKGGFAKWMSEEGRFARSEEGVQSTAGSNAFLHGSAGAALDRREPADALVNGVPGVGRGSTVGGDGPRSDGRGRGDAHNLPARTVPSWGLGAVRSRGPSPVAGAPPATGSSDRGPVTEYHPPALIHAVRPEPGAGVRITSGVEVGFAYVPGQYRDGALRLANDSGVPLVISFHGAGSSSVRLNGQEIVEGRTYLVVGDAEIAGAQAVGVHVRHPKGKEREAAPDGVG